MWRYPVIFLLTLFVVQRTLETISVNEDNAAIAGFVIATVGTLYQLWHNRKQRKKDERRN